VAVLDEEFINTIGRPDPATPNGLHFSGAWFQRKWDQLHPLIGSGWFVDGFLYLFGEGLADLSACLEAWSFLVPPHDDRVIVGRNAYGAILVLENPSTAGSQRVCVLDPWTVTYYGDENLNFTSLIARALPQRELVEFLDDRAYRQWRQQNQVARLGLDDVLGIKVPKPLGGKLEASNLQLDGIVDYYKTTGPIYAEAFAKLKVQ
jgi:hypothetical protein